VFEGLFLKKIPRSGYLYLGRGAESVAEHSFGVIFLAYTLYQKAILLNPEVSLEKLLKLALFHDLAEARTGDLNYLNKRYVTSLEESATTDALKGLPFADELYLLYQEWKEGKTRESQLAADADQLDMIVELVKIRTEGSPSAEEWLNYALMRLKTQEGKELAQAILNRKPDTWWFEKNTSLWVNPPVAQETIPNPAAPEPDKTPKKP
jgi:putative hydrolase of HD superfamily